MCGIVGYIGNGNVYDILIKGLHRLEYRGYDSAGVALVGNDGKLNVYKTMGKVSNLEAYCADKVTDCRAGIAHTRWATHGEPSDFNAHPHFSEDGNIALVHNGTIENYKVLKDALVQHGRKFKSETDTEVLAQLIEYVRVTNKCSLLEAVRHALKQVVGAYAIAVVQKDNPDTIIAARQSSPLVIGIGDGETFLASDATPFVEYTKKCVYLKDGEIAEIKRNEPLNITDLNNVKAEIDVTKLEMSISQLEKGGYAHFMRRCAVAHGFENIEPCKISAALPLQFCCSRFAASCYNNLKPAACAAARVPGTRGCAGAHGFENIETRKTAASAVLSRPLRGCAHAACGAQYAGTGRAGLF